MKRMLAMVSLLLAVPQARAATLPVTKIAVWNKRFTVLDSEAPRKIRQGWLRLRYAAPMMRAEIPVTGKATAEPASLRLTTVLIEVHPKPADAAQTHAVNTRLEVHRMLVDWDPKTGLKHTMRDQPVAGIHYEAKPFAVLPLANALKSGQTLTVNGFGETLAKWRSGQWPNYGFIMTLVQTGSPSVIQINYRVSDHPLTAAILTGPDADVTPDRPARISGVQADGKPLVEEIQLIDLSYRPIALRQVAPNRYLYGKKETLTVTRRRTAESEILHVGLPDNTSARGVRLVIAPEAAARARPPVISVYSERIFKNQRNTWLVPFEGGAAVRMTGRRKERAATATFSIAEPGQRATYDCSLKAPGEIVAEVAWGQRAAALVAGDDSVNAAEELAFTGGLKMSTLLHRERKYLFTGERAEITPEVVRFGPTPKLTATWKVFDEKGTVVKQGAIELPPETEGRLEPVSFACGMNGIWRFALEVSENGRARQQRETLIGVLPRHGITKAEEMPFGFCRHAWQRHDHAARNRLSKDIGAGWFRMWIRLFLDVELKDDDLVYRLNPRAIDVLRRIHDEQDMRVMAVVGPLAFSKNWQKKIRAWSIDLKKKDPARFKKLYERTLMQLVPALAPYVDVWETMNEPYFEHQDEVPFYVELSAMTRRIVAKHDPTAKVVGICGPPGTNGYRWYAEVMAAGDLVNQDIVSHHPYTTGYGTEYLPANWSRAVAALIKKHGGKQPLWNTESGLQPVTYYRLPAYHYLDMSRFKSMRFEARACAAMLVKQSLAAFAGGTEKCFIFTHSGQRTQSLDQLEFDGTPKHASVGYAAVTKFLRGRAFAGELQSGEAPDFRAPAFKGADGATIALLAVGYRPGESMVVTAPPGDWRFYDTYANPIDCPTDGKLTLAEDVIYAVASDSARLPAPGSLRVIERRRQKTTVKAQEVRDDTTQADWNNRVAIDLKPYVTRSFTDTHPADGLGGWSDEGDNDMRNLPVGKLKLAGVPFVVIDPKTHHDKACLVMKSAGNYPAPERVKIAMGQKVRALHFLHTSTYTADNLVANLIVHYMDGTRVTIPIRSKFELNDWYADEKPQNAEIAWRGPNAKHDGVCLFKFTWANPNPTTPIDAVEVVSRVRSSRYILVAITADLGF